VRLGKLIVRKLFFFGWIPGKLPKKWVEAGFAKKANTIAELATTALKYCKGAGEGPPAVMFMP
jgi:hypothetical protein